MSWNIDEALAPSLRMLFALELVSDSRDAPPAPTLVAKAIRELQQPVVAQSLTVDQFVTLVKIAVAQANGNPDDEAALLDPLRLLLNERWTSLASAVLRHTVEHETYEQPLLYALPALREAPEILDILTRTADRSRHGWEKHLNFAAMRPSLDQVRSALSGLSGEHGRSLRVRLIESLAQRDGWTPWLSLFAILWHHPGLASDSAPHDQGDGAGAPPLESPVQRADRTLWSELRDRVDIRHLAGLVQDLDGPLRESPPDFRDVYLERLRAAVGEDAELRQAAIEALLWKGEQKARPMAAFAATHLAVDEDIEFLRALSQGPDRRIGYAAATVLAALTDREAVAPPSTTSADAPSSAAEPERPRTWLGDRSFEKAVEATIAAAESQIALEYVNHHADGEEKLGVRFFTLLEERFRHLESAFKDRAGRLGEVPDASVEMSYRPVDKAEEGRPGIVPAGRTKRVSRFSADFCLLITAHLEEEILTRRAILIQAKRLRRERPTEKDSPWMASFRLDAKQTRELIEQTGSSFFMFHGPVELALSAGIIPARLVEDLAINQAAKAEALSTGRVQAAAQTFSEWFTYQAMGLRTGDPYAKLLSKAEKGPGSSPYPLVRYGTLSVDVRRGRPKRGDV